MKYTIIIALILLVSCEKEKTPEERAYDFACNCVKLKLKAPATAIFPPVEEASTIVADNAYYVSAYVDSENGFGALLRKDFNVMLTSKEKTFECITISFPSKSDVDF